MNTPPPLSPASDTTCFFCGRNPAEASCAQPTKLWRLKSVGAMSLYDTLEFNVPRCANCLAIHLNSDKWRRVV